VLVILQALRLDVEGDFNSFRVGHLLQYQRTYLFPPKPTLIGLLGAALGLEDWQLTSLYEDVWASVILCQRHGFARDLWGITKIKTSGKTEHAVVVREMLHCPSYRIFFAPKSCSVKLPDMKAAFANPAYPLALGRSDELVVIKTCGVSDLQPASRGAWFRHTVLPFDYRKRRCILEKIGVSTGGILELPQVFRLPVAYSYDKDRKRRVTRYDLFTHVFGTGVSLDSEEGWCDDGKSFFLY